MPGTEQSVNLMFPLVRIIKMLTCKERLHVVAETIPESVLNENEQLHMIFDTAVTCSGDESN